MGLKSKQLDLNDLAVQLITLIGGNTTYKNNWKNILEVDGTIFLSAVFSTANSNISNGQIAFSVAYAIPIVNIFVFKNGLKLIENVDYTHAPTSGSFTVTLTSSVSTADVLEFNYH